MQIFSRKALWAPKVNMQASEVQVWSASPNEFGEAECAALARLLDANETAQRDRLRHEADRRAYLVAHALRRLALGQALDVPPAELRFGTDAHGKPFLAWPPGSGLFFSHAHARQAVACAVTRSGEIGVDVEHAQGEADFSLLDRFMALASPQERESERFFFYWTALEAFWKAHGLGLSTAHPRIRLREAPGGFFEAAFEHDHPGTRRARVTRLPSRSGCAITLAVLGSADEPFFTSPAVPHVSRPNLI